MGEIDFAQVAATAERLGHSSDTARKLATRLRNGLERRIGNSEPVTEESVRAVYERGPIQKEAGLRSVYLPNVGLNALRVLYHHLHDHGVDLFPDGYTAKELGE